MARDNFLESVIDKLRMRVSNRCSNPNCRVPTTAPSGDEDKVNNIGIAAHICAASPGGPRYSREMTTEERKSINNAIWLCSNCSIEIDRDEPKYTVSLLNQWKTEAESAAKEELGKRLPGKTDAINTVSAALTGFPKSFLASAISNVHKASEQSLEALDPRFAVKSSHSESGTGFGIFAREDVNVSMNIQGEYEKEYIDKYKRLVEHGEDFEIYAGAIKFDGSKLIEEITNISENGKMIISSTKKKGIQKLWLVSKETALIETFEDIRGVISFGNKSFGFEGAACDGMFTFRYRKGIDENNATITFGIDFHRWEGCDVRYLPYFSKFFSFFEKLAKGWELFTALEIDGIRVLDSKGMDASKMEFVTETRSVLYYIDKVSEIAGYLEELVRFSSVFSYTPEEFKRVIDVVEIITRKCIYSENNITSNASCELIVDEDARNIELLSSMTEPTNVIFNEKSNESIECFGRNLYLPAKSISLNKVTPRIVSPQSSYKQGDVVQVEWIPSSGFECKVEYAKP